MTKLGDKQDSPWTDSASPIERVRSNCHHEIQFACSSVGRSLRCSLAKSNTYSSTITNHMYISLTINFFKYMYSHSTFRFTKNAGVALQIIL